MQAIYVGRGLDAELAAQVATQLMDHDALGAHARDELGISEIMTARPVQAALASAATFSVGAALPLLVVVLVPASALMWTVSGSSLFFLALLGSLSARTGGPPMITAAVARHLLGRTGHGAHRRGRRVVRRGCLARGAGYLLLEAGLHLQHRLGALQACRQSGDSLLRVKVSEQRGLAAVGLDQDIATALQPGFLPLRAGAQSFQPRQGGFKMALCHFQIDCRQAERG